MLLQSCICRISHWKKSCHLIVQENVYPCCLYMKIRKGFYCHDDDSSEHIKDINHMPHLHIIRYRVNLYFGHLMLRQFVTFRIGQSILASREAASENLLSFLDSKFFIVSGCALLRIISHIHMFRVDRHLLSGAFKYWNISHTHAHVYSPL